MFGFFEMFIAIGLIGVLVMLYRNQRYHELADHLVRHYCRRHGLQFLGGTVSLRKITVSRQPLMLCRSYRFDYSLSSVDRFHGSVTLCGEHYQSFRVQPDHLPSNDLVVL